MHNEDSSMVSSDGVVAPVEHFSTVDNLHTDHLEKKYGKIHAHVLAHDDVESESHGDFGPIREACLEDEQGISRTYALTFLTYDPTNEAMYSIDSTIREGGLIGKSFRDKGYEVRKNVINVFTLPVPKWMAEAFHEPEAKYVKARISEFYAKKEGEEPVIYGRVLEVYPNDFRRPVINVVDQQQVNPSTEQLERVGISKDEIWGKLEHAADVGEWSDREAEYERAKEASLDEVFAWREKIANYFTTK